MVFVKNKNGRIYEKRGNHTLWRYDGKCAYQSEFHKGKSEWHHPIRVMWHCGFFLCEAHHSLLNGRRFRYLGEMNINKTLKEMREEIKEMEKRVVLAAGFDPSCIDKR